MRNSNLKEIKHTLEDDYPFGLNTLSMIWSRNTGNNCIKKTSFPSEKEAFLFFNELR